MGLLNAKIEELLDTNICIYYCTQSCMRQFTVNSPLDYLNSVPDDNYMS